MTKLEFDPTFLTKSLKEDNTIKFKIKNKLILELNDK